MNDFIQDFEVLIATFPTELSAIDTIAFSAKAHFYFLLHQ